MTEQQVRIAEANDGRPTDRSIKEIVDALRPQLQELTQKQVELARSELAPVGKKAGLAGGLLAVGAVFLHLFLVFLAVAGIYLFNLIPGVALWAAAAIVAGILLVIGGALAGAALSLIRNLDPKPHHTIRTFQQNLEWLKGQFRR